MTHTSLRRVRVRVPATSANLGPGFDAFGLALTLADEVTVEADVPSVATRADERTIAVEVDGEGAESTPRDQTHLIVRAIDATFDQLDRPRPRWLRVSCVNRIPHARGLGSSAAAIVAGIMAARALVSDGDRVLPDPQMLHLAARLEGHPDNVAACLFGGFTIAWNVGDGAPARAVRLEPAEIPLVAYVPDEPMSTEAARGLLPERVGHAEAAASAGRAGLLVGALTGAVTDSAAWEIAVADLLHQPYRAPAMPDSARLVEWLRTAGVPAVISGAGPTVLAFGRTEDIDDLRTVEGFRSFSLRVDRAGSTVRMDLDPDVR